MKVRYKKQLLLGLMVSLWLSFSQVGNSQTTSDLLKRRVQAVHVEAVNALVALSHIAEDYEIPIGVEAASRGKGREIKVDVRDGTLRDVLDAVIKQDPRYEWKEEGGVINFIPRSDRDELSADVLGTTLKQFVVKKGVALLDVKRDIVDQPEVNAKLDRAKVVTRIGGFTGWDFRKPGPDFTLQMSNVTVREVLNQIIRTSDVKYWVVNRYGDNYEIFLLNF